MGKSKITIPVPPSFNFRTVINSHGWYQLPPFHWDAEKATLSAVLRVDHVPTSVTLQVEADQVVADAEMAERWTAAKRRQCVETLRTMLGLHLDFAEFYTLHEERFLWAQQIGAGPFLRSGSLFEDAVKMLCTTNCSWALTKSMVNKLVHHLGEDAPRDQRAFPTPAQMAQMPVSFYKETIRAGYRSDALQRFAAQVDSGEVDLGRWEQWEGSTADLVKEITKLKGFGPYTAENLCKLLGRFDFLGIDSWCVRKFPSIYPNAKGKSTEQAIRATYAKYGSWQGLALWLDLTKEWHEGERVEKFSGNP